MTDDLKDLERQIGKVPKIFKELTMTDPEMYNMVIKLEKHIWDDGALTRQTKKLIAIAIAASMRDEHAVLCATQGSRKSRDLKERS